MLSSISAAVLQKCASGGSEANSAKRNAVCDPVELCSQVHLVVSRMDPRHNTVTMVTLYRALLLELEGLQSSSNSVHVKPLQSFTSFKLADLLQKHTENADLALQYYHQCVSGNIYSNDLIKKCLHVIRSLFRWSWDELQLITRIK